MKPLPDGEPEMYQCIECSAPTWDEDSLCLTCELKIQDERQLKYGIGVGDIVSVNFNNAQTTLCNRAEVIDIPIATGDFWHFRELWSDTVHYVSEGCTVTKLKDQERDDH